MYTQKMNKYSGK